VAEGRGGVVKISKDYRRSFAETSLQRPCSGEP
jgi:hypothetical protein